ncbi:tetratricopeptide repeat protein [candidate division KSB1 bacterium]|nr:tetratricopeptide repeat protein [candidate division KSB1 bacterium]
MKVKAARSVNFMLVAVILCAEAFAQDEFYIKRITENGVIVAQTAGASVVAYGLETPARVNMTLRVGDWVKVLSPVVSVLVQGLGNGAEVYYNKAPGIYRLGTTQSREAAFEQPSGGVNYRVFSKFVQWFRTLVGPTERAVPIEVEGTIFSVAIDANNSIEIVVTEGRIRVGQPGTALYREIENGRFLNLAPGAQPQQGPVQRQTILRINNEVSEISVSEGFGDETGEGLVLADTLLPRPAFFATRLGGVQYRQTNVRIHHGQTPAERDSTIESYRRGGARLVDVSSPLQCWSYADYAYEVLRELSEAKKFYQLALDQSPDSLKTELLYNLGVVCLESTQFEEAEDYWRRALLLAPQDTGILLSLSRLYVLHNEYDQIVKAHAFLQKALAQGELSTDNLYDAAVIADRLNQPRKAFFLFRKANHFYEMTGEFLPQSFCQWGMGDALYVSLAAVGALEHYRRMQTLLDSLRTTVPEQPEIVRFLAVAHNKTGDALSLLGDEKGAAEQYELALRSRQVLANVFPHESGVQHELAISLERAGDVFKKGKDFPRAIEAYNHALEIREKRISGFSKPEEVTRAFTILWNKLGEAYGEIGERGRALEYHIKALSAREKLAAQRPNDWIAQGDLASSYERLGWLFSSQPDSALVYYERALRLREQIAAADSQRPDYWQTFAATCEQAAKFSESANDYARAIALYRKAASARGQEYKLQPENKTAQLQLAQTYAHIGDLYLNHQREYEQAQENYEKALFILQHMPNADTTTADFVRQLAGSLEELADFMEPEKRLALLKQARTLRQLVIGKAAENTRDDLALAHLADKLAAFWLESQNFDSAKVYLPEAVTFHERAFRAHPTNLQLLKELVDVLYDLGKLLKLKGEALEDARAYWVRAEALLREHADETGIKGTRYEQLLEALRHELQKR